MWKKKIMIKIFLIKVFMYISSAYEIHKGPTPSVYVARSKASNQVKGDTKNFQ